MYVPCKRVSRNQGGADSAVHASAHLSERRSRGSAAVATSRPLVCAMSDSDVDLLLSREQKEAIQMTQQQYVVRLRGEYGTHGTTNFSPKTLLHCVMERPSKTTSRYTLWSTVGSGPIVASALVTSMAPQFVSMVSRPGVAIRGPVYQFTLTSLACRVLTYECGRFVYCCSRQQDQTHSRIFPAKEMRKGTNECSDTVTTHIADSQGDPPFVTIGFPVVPPGAHPDVKGGTVTRNEKSGDSEMRSSAPARKE